MVIQVLMLAAFICSIISVLVPWAHVTSTDKDDQVKFVIGPFGVKVCSSEGACHTIHVDEEVACFLLDPLLQYFFFSKFVFVSF